MSTYGRAQDSLWDVLEGFGIDPKMKAEGYEGCLLDALVDFSRDVWFNAGVEHGKHLTAKRLEQFILAPDDSEDGS